MRPIELVLKLDFEEEIDNAIYGDFYLHTRDGLHFDGKPFVQMEYGGEWIPVEDWKTGEYKMKPETIKRLARHFIEIGKRLKEEPKPEEGEWLSARMATKELNKRGLGIQFFGNLFTYLRKRGQLEGLCELGRRGMQPVWLYDVDGIAEKVKKGELNYVPQWKKN